jgi:hypothetical protein
MFDAVSIFTALEEQLGLIVRDFSTLADQYSAVSAVDRHAQAHLP